MCYRCGISIHNQNHVGGARCAGGLRPLLPFYPLVLAAGRLRVLRDMLAKFGEMGPKPLRPARPAIRDAEPQKMLRKRRRAWPR
jgi:hypothetical protein